MDSHKTKETEIHNTGKGGKKREWPTAKWMDSIIVARGTQMEELKSQVRDRSS